MEREKTWNKITFLGGLIKIWKTINQTQFKNRYFGIPSLAKFSFIGRDALKYELLPKM